MQFTNIIENISVDRENKNFFIQLGDFLDAFYSVNSNIKAQMIENPPIFNRGSSQVYFAYLASAAHKLANENKLAVPEWVYDEKSYLKHPYFGSSVRGNLRLIYLYMSPPEFKHRNLFVDPQALSRI